MKSSHSLFLNGNTVMVPWLRYPCLFLIVAAFLLCGQPVKAAGGQSEDGWQFMAEAYLWYASMEGESNTDGEIQIDNNDLVDNLDFGFMATVGAQKDKWFFGVDTIYLDVSDNMSNTIGGVGVNGKVELSGWIVTPLVGYEMYRADKTNFNIVGGARYLYLSTDLTLGNSDPSSTPFLYSVSDSGNNWDAVIGLKGDYFISDNWFVPYYLDIGAGNSQFTWQAMAGLGYRFGICDVLVAYRYLEWNFDDAVLDNLNVSGVAAGVRFFF